MYSIGAPNSGAVGYPGALCTGARSMRALDSTMGIVILESIGIVAMGIALGYVGMRLIGQYRKAFFAALLITDSHPKRITEKTLRRD